MTLHKDPGDKNKLKVLTAGVFDYFHYGHLRLFKQIKNFIPDCRLIVAVQDGEYIKKFKPETNVFYSTDIRCELIYALKIVDDVLTYKTIDSIVREVDFDVLALGEDQNHEGFKEAERYCRNNSKSVLRLQRTKNISSTLIKQQIEEYR